MILEFRFIPPKLIFSEESCVWWTYTTSSAGRGPIYQMTYLSDDLFESRAHIVASRLPPNRQKVQFLSLFVVVVEIFVGWKKRSTFLENVHFVLYSQINKPSFLTFRCWFLFVCLLLVFILFYFFKSIDQHFVTRRGILNPNLLNRKFRLWNFSFPYIVLMLIILCKSPPPSSPKKNHLII